jgi:hypothetical protein
MKRAGIGARPAEWFIYLQVLDFLTTVVALELGLSEMSPFVRFLIDKVEHPVVGVMLAKIAACGIGAYCLMRNRRRILFWLNLWFSILVVWNLAMLYWYAKYFVRKG